MLVDNDKYVRLIQFLKLLIKFGCLLNKIQELFMQMYQIWM